MISVLHWNKVWMYTFDDIVYKVPKYMGWIDAHSWNPVFECRTKGEMRKWIKENYPEEEYKFVVFYHDPGRNRHDWNPLPSRPKKKFKRHDYK